MQYKKLTLEELNRIITQIETERSKNCIKCGSSLKRNKREGRVRCEWKACKARYSIWTNTIFEKSKLNQIEILQILELWMQKASLNLISYVLNINRKSIWRVMKKVSTILVPKYYDKNEIIGGEQQIIEIDESKFGKRKYHKGHHVEGVWVFGMIEKNEPKRVKLVVVDERTKQTLTTKLIENVHTESVIHSDCWKGYTDVKNVFSEHKTVNHSIGFKNKDTGVHTNTIEGTWNAIKMHVPLRGRTKDKINLYLVRYMLLKNESEHPLTRIIKYLF